MIQDREDLLKALRRWIKRHEMKGYPIEIINGVESVEMEFKYLYLRDIESLTKLLRRKNANTAYLTNYKAEGNSFMLRII